MPPSILQNAVQQVAAKLPVKLSSAILDKAGERLRILETRVRAGQLGKGDRTETRAAALLEYVTREQDGPRLSWPMLASAVGCKPKALEQLHSIIGNYMQPATRPKPIVKRYVGSFVAKPAALAVAQKPATSTTALPKKRSLRSANEDNPADILPALSIRLASHIADPHGVVSRAHALLESIHAHVESLTNQYEKRGYQYDLQRYGPAYQAACFYYYARPSQRPKSGGDEARSLELLDLVSACNHFTYLELKQVWPHVTQLADQLVEQKEKEQALTTNKSKKAKLSSKASVNESDSQTVPAEQLLSGRTTDADKASKEAEATLMQFTKWQEEMVANNVFQAKQSLSKEGNVSIDSVSDEAALALAADNVLQKHGLLDSSMAQVVLET